MAKFCNLFLDKGADLSVVVQLIGINRQPIDISDMSFACMAKFMMKESVKVNINCVIEDARTGYLRLYLPYHITEKMPLGDWLYDIEMTDKANRRTRVLQGKLAVNDETTVSW